MNFKLGDNCVISCRFISCLGFQISVADLPAAFLIIVSRCDVSGFAWLKEE